MRKFRQLTKLLVLAFVVSMMLPDNWYDWYHFREVPLSVVMLASLSFVLLLYLMLNPSIVNSWLWGGGTVLTAMSINGYLRGNIGSYSLKFFVADLFCFSALLAGFAFALTRSRDDTARLVSQIAMIASVVIIVTYIALFFGFVSTDFNIPGRLVTGSIFNAVGILQILLPWASVSMNNLRLHSGWRLWLLFGSTVATGLLSGTRSIIVVSALIGMLYLILRRRRLRPAFFLRVSAVIIVVTASFLSGWSHFGSFAFQRLNDTQLNEESRWEELKLWWPQIKDDVGTGQGMGSRFVSNIVVDGDPLASATHVGIMTFLMKGGVLVFLAFVIVPLTLAISVLSSSVLTEGQRGAAASVLVFIGLSSLSGGWFPLSMFSYGLAIASMAPEASRLTWLTVRTGQSAQGQHQIFLRPA